MGTSTIIINLAYVALLLATFARAMVPLRVFLAASGLGFIAFGVLIDNWSIVGWSVVTTGFHLHQLRRCCRSQPRVSVGRQEHVIRCRYFPGLSDVDFVSLWALGETVEHVDVPVMRRHEVHGRIALILDGTVVVDRSSGPIRLTQGALLGEVTFVAGGAAAAAARAVGRVQLREWRHEEVRSLEVSNPPAFAALQRLIQRDLVAKVA